MNIKKFTPTGSGYSYKAYVPSHKTDESLILGVIGTYHGNGVDAYRFLQEFNNSWDKKHLSEHVMAAKHGVLNEFLDYKTEVMRRVAYNKFPRAREGLERLVGK